MTANDLFLATARREYFAALMLQGILITSEDLEDSVEENASLAINYADELLKQLQAPVTEKL